MVAEHLRSRSPGAVLEDPDRERVNKINAKKVTIIIVLGLLMTLLISYSVTIGSTTITPLQVYKVFINQVVPGLFDIPYKTEQIVLQIYAPRVLMAAFVGGILAASGCIIQAIMKNPWPLRTP